MYPANCVLINAGYQTAGGDPVFALRKATAAVCAKLKTDYGSNLRVYVIKYRRQTQYKNYITSENENHSYTDIDKCATDTNGASYEVDNEADLNSTLNTIANNIKSFAGGVTPAKVD